MSPVSSKSIFAPVYGPYRVFNGTFTSVKTPFPAFGIPDSAMRRLPGSVFTAYLALDLVLAGTAVSATIWKMCLTHWGPWINLSH
jgi:hypothetical protein